MFKEWNKQAWKLLITLLWEKLLVNKGKSWTKSQLYPILALNPESHNLIGCLLFHIWKQNVHSIRSWLQVYFKFCLKCFVSKYDNLASSPTSSKKYSWLFGCNVNQASSEKYLGFSNFHLWRNTSRQIASYVTLHLASPLTTCWCNMLCH